MKIKTRTTCRVCAGALEPILSLGDHYVSDFLPPEKKDGVKAPLELVLCNCCYLLQLKHTVPAESMYQNYWYRSGTNKSMRDALADICHKAESLIHITAKDAVLDIGCNDGTLLASYKTGGIYKIGFDPAQNLAVFSRKAADKVASDFFTADVFLKDPSLRAHRPKIITSIAMFYDLEDPGKFVADIRRVLHPQGVWVVQMSYLPAMLKQNAFDNICHEHLEYYSLQSFEYLLKRHNFEIADIELNDVNGGSFRAYIRHARADRKNFADPTYRSLAAERLAAVRKSEISMGLDDTQEYCDFAKRVERIKNDVAGFIREEVRRRKKVYVYGASTKGNTLLQYFGLDRTLITAAAERNPDKWGKVTVGTRIPIISEEEARAAQPHYFLILPWHFIEEFKAREKEYLSGKGRFLVPLPHFSLI